MVGNGQQSHFQLAARCISDGVQVIQSCFGQGELRVILVVGPGKYHLARRRKGTDVVHMFVGLVLIDAPGQPQYLADAEILGQGGINLLPAQGGVAACTEQAGFGSEEGALAVHMDGAALQHKIARVVAVDTQRFT